MNEDIINRMTNDFYTGLSIISRLDGDIVKLTNYVKSLGRVSPSVVTAVLHYYIDYAK